MTNWRLTRNYPAGLAGSTPMGGEGLLSALCFSSSRCTMVIQVFVKPLACALFPGLDVRALEGLCCIILSLCNEWVGYPEGIGLREARSECRESEVPSPARAKMSEELILTPVLCPRRRGFALLKPCRSGQGNWGKCLIMTTPRVSRRPVRTKGTPLPAHPCQGFPMPHNAHQAHRTVRSRSESGVGNVLLMRREMTQ